MRNTKAFTVESRWFAQAQHVCRTCAMAMVDDETWISGNSDWHVGLPCDRCGKYIGGAVGRVIHEMTVSRMLKDRDRRLAIHERHHEDQCCFDDDDCVAGRFWVTE